MNKKVFGRKLSRSRPAREALFAALIRSMILNGKINTTMAKAKAIQGDLEHIITLAKKADLTSRRKALAYLDNARSVSDLLFQQVGTFFKNRTSGFTRITSLPQRRGDNAKMARIEWTEKVVLSDKKLEVSKKEKKAKSVETKKIEKKEIKSKSKTKS
jgi:large subunit ribosomal protein L17